MSYDNLIEIYFYYLCIMCQIIVFFLFLIHFFLIISTHSFGNFSTAVLRNFTFFCYLFHFFSCLFRLELFFLMSVTTLRNQSFFRLILWLLTYFLLWRNQMSLIKFDNFNLYNRNNWEVQSVFWDFIIKKFKYNIMKCIRISYCKKISN